MRQVDYPNPPGVDKFCNSCWPGLSPARLKRAAALISAAARDCLVTGFESLEAGLMSLADPDDRHVLCFGQRGGVILLNRGSAW